VVGKRKESITPGPAITLIFYLREAGEKTLTLGFSQSIERPSNK